MVGEVADLDRKSGARVCVAFEVDVGVAVKVQRGQPVYVPAQHRLLRLVQVEHLHIAAAQLQWIQQLEWLQRPCYVLVQHRLLRLVQVYPASQITKSTGP